MTTVHSSTTFQGSLRRKAAAKRSALRLCWTVAASAIGRAGPGVVTLELTLQDGATPRLAIDGCETAIAEEWFAVPAGGLGVRCERAGGMLIVDASPIAVVIFQAEDVSRPMHVACDLPAVLGLSGGRYELASGSLSA